MDVQDVSKKLRKWLADVSDDHIDPWKDLEETENESPSRNAKPIDPTQDFTDVSDLYSDCSSSEESYEDGEEENEDSKNYTYRGYRDEEGFFHSSGTIEFENGDIIHAVFKHGIRNGDAVVISPRAGISRLIGTYVNGKLQGKGQLVRTENLHRNYNIPERFNAH